jgi:hypothetical protein
MSSSRRRSVLQVLARLVELDRWEGTGGDGNGACNVEYRGRERAGSNIH